MQLMVYLWVILNSQCFIPVLCNAFIYIDFVGCLIESELI